ncbi:chitin deacetylase 7-like isoform X2 [Babylonia areolata]
MVLVTLDDHVNWSNWELYLRLFPPESSRRNPNGCPQAATFFVSHNATDYCMVRKLFARQMEIADHSVTHRMPHAWWAGANSSQIGYEVLTQRSHLADLTHIPLEEIRGWRSPFLQPSGDNLFQVLQENNFTYDATLTYPFPRNVYSPVLWPFTLDFSYPLVCNIPPCPTRTYPGLWVVPVVVVMDYREHLPCAYIDHCINEPRDHDETFEMLWKNFQRNYRTNRAPLYVNLHSKWLETDFHLEAMADFLQRLTSMDDVYVVTVTDAIAWVRDPAPLSRVKDFQPWSCPGFRPFQEDAEDCKLNARPPTTTTTPASSPTPFRQFYHTALPSDLQERTGDVDHNGVRRSKRTGGRDTPGTAQQGHRGQGHMARKSWFMGSGSKGSCGEWATVVVCGAISGFLVRLS